MPRDGSRTTAKGKWNRDGLLACRQCGSSDRPHEAHGLCKRCFSNWRYHDQIDHMKRKRKLSRLRASEEATRAQYERQQAWKAANRERALASQKAAYLRVKNSLNKWPIGARVEVLFAGFWCAGTIVGRINNLKVLVRLTGGTELEIGTRKPEGMRRVDAEAA